MSGSTLAAGSRVAPGGRAHGGLQELAQESGSLGGVTGSLRVIQLQLVAFIVVFSASGLVPLLDLAFPVFASLYALFLGSVVFPNYHRRRSTAPVFKGSRLFQLYVILGTVLGLFLPLGYVLGGFARGDQASVRAATPHLFLLSVQILSENLISGLELFSLPVRALLPIIYTGRRIVALSSWVHVTLKASIPPQHDFQKAAWVWFGRSLAIANYVFYSVNLLGFLIPLFLPRAFERYFQDRDEYYKEKEQSSATARGPEKKSQ
ncbi:hypothetical protein SELMODRAFT_171589 [Selaginella moellendorffii]|uniref:DUF7733 domain-containing protein n=1 Tax=Selaginella moellendorffii TaxID=88036 RepID=D8RHG3_SELML|nr:uncharacterized protein LOC9631962 [Selaginella moellendorffii]EFJ28522.1 hypothetical protein SELMODRAFT_171589 [Selaginella moellendorffii]|eukprot:XP_002970392.1 uncharacterized protein LOC9631962 [Selaginella moellendorffii]